VHPADLLSIARDALAERRWGEAFAIFAELGPDFAYRGRRTQLRHPRPYLVTDYGAYDDEDGDPEPLEDQRRSQLREWRAIGWRAWREPPRPLQTSSYDGVLKSYYSEDRIATMSMREHPLLAMLDRAPRPRVVAVGPVTYETLRRRLGVVADAGAVWSVATRRHFAGMVT
jgi:hypothetical protein